MTHDYFELFGLTPSFSLDAQALHQAWKQASAKVHPDRYATALPAEKRLAVQWAGLINQAYDTLKQPLQRAVHLCEQNGRELEAESNTSMAPDFLMTQMQLRESLAEACGDPAALQQLLHEVQSLEAEFNTRMAAAIDEHQDWDAAVALCREWMFIDKLKKQIQLQIN